MAQFAKTTFSHASYAAFRPSYPLLLYNTILAYHQGPKSLCFDLGTGHGMVARYLAPSFAKVVGTDPSTGMIDQAKSSTAQSEYPNVEFEVSSAEEMPFVKDQSVDMVVSGQAAHWFSQPQFWPEMHRILRKNGTIALWVYKDHIFVNSPVATAITDHYAYANDSSLLGPYWEQPGRSILRDKLRDMHAPTTGWDDAQRIEYEPGTNGPGTGEGTMFLSRKMKLGDVEKYVRTWSSVSAWQEKYPERKRRAEGGEGDVVDEMFEKMVEAEGRWQGRGNWREVEVEVEWGSALVLARRTGV